MTIKHTKRTSLSTVTAVVVTTGLFFTMSQLVASDEVPIDPIQRQIWIDPVQTDVPDETDDYIDPVVEPIDIIDPPETGEPEPPKPCVENCITYTEPTLPGENGPAELDPQKSDRGAFLLVANPPQYPAGAANRGIEGYVTLSFTIDENGMVQNPSIIDAEPEGVFEKASLKAIKRFKFKPAMMSGSPQPTHNVQYKLTYELPK